MPIKLPFGGRRQSYPTDLWTRCPGCQEMLYNKQLDKNQRVCPKCGHHFRLGSGARLALLLDRDSFHERTPACSRWTCSASSTRSPIRIGSTRRAPQPGHAMRRYGAPARSRARRLVTCVMDFAFMGGSMGTVVGEKVTRAAEYALEERLPLIIVSASGGARMQEGTLSLMQLAKTVAALGRLAEADVPYISVLTDPTTGGVFASFAALGRHQPRRAELADRLCRCAGRRRHHRRIAAGRLPARRVPARARFRRPDRGACPTARHAARPAALHAPVAAGRTQRP